MALATDISGAEGVPLQERSYATGSDDCGAIHGHQYLPPSACDDDFYALFQAAAAVGSSPHGNNDDTRSVPIGWQKIRDSGLFRIRLEKNPGSVEPIRRSENPRFHATSARLDRRQAGAISRIGTHRRRHMRTGPNRYGLPSDVFLCPRTSRACETPSSAPRSGPALRDRIPTSPSEVSSEVGRHPRDRGRGRPASH